MFFRNLTLFRFPASTSRALKKLDQHLPSHRLRECGPLELATQGFVSPYGRDSEALLHQVGAFTLVTIGAEERLLPSVVVNEALAERVSQIAEKSGRRVGGKERKRLKEEVISELLPRAFIRPSRRCAYLDAEQGWLVVDTASRKAAEDAVSRLRQALGRFPATPMAPKESPRALMTRWLIDNKLPKGLTLGEECELRDPAEAGAVVRCRRQDLESDEVKEHLKSGKHVFQLALVFDDRMSFVLGEDFVVRKLKFLDIVLDELGQDTSESAQAELDASFALMTLELRNLFEHLESWFGLPRPGERD
ncbi:MAG: recombination-associated protein RdgC [Rhodanobacter sp.]|jgi:recombination associated protein RdgC|nr:recombination-associated protein RdgC [Rhodanobacter sp.]